MGIEVDPSMIESLPNLIEIYGLCIVPHSDDKSLDKLFATCGHSLKKLGLKIKEGGHIPQALKRKSNLKELTLQC